MRWQRGRIDEPAHVHAAFPAGHGHHGGPVAHQPALGLAQRQLESTDRSMEQIAIDAGFGSAVSLRQHFAATLGTSPSAYRREFRGS
jgi:transcriptional regulator GlxA family with amidase domain